MKERPVIFNGEMVRAVLDGRKTQTRRVVKPQPIYENGLWHFKWGAGCSLDHMPVMPGHATAAACPYGVPGGRLWVRESFFIPRDTTTATVQAGEISYTEDEPKLMQGHWCKKPSIHMPRWASRITLEVTGVRVERVQRISPEDCLCEGIKMRGFSHEAPFNAVDDFRRLWNGINEKRGYGWKANPWVWVVEFRRVES